MKATCKRISALRLSTGMARATTPTDGSHGCDISAWLTLYGDRPPASYLVYLMGSLAATVSAGAALWLYFLDIGEWFQAGVLNGGAAITIDSATGGYMQEVRLVGLASRMCVVGTWSAGVAAVACEPLEES